jgi:ABC-2 type transport system ATP-binding protein
VIHAEGVGKTFRPPLGARRAAVVALDGVSLDVARGEAVALMGANGAGKSTLLRIVAGLLRATAGRVTVCGLDAAAGGAALAHKIGYVAADERGVTAALTPREHLAFFAALYGMRRPAALARAEALLDTVGAAAYARRPMRELSTGLRRRVALARALVGAPEVLILDEPTRGLDPDGAAALHAHLRGVLDRGACALFATHDRAEAAALAQRTLRLDAGRALAAGASAADAADVGGGA